MSGLLSPTTVKNLRRGVLTTGDVANICHIAPRTASKWIDTKRLKGYRVPMSQDRRVRLMDLYAFMKDNGLPTDAIDRYILHKVLLIGLEEVTAKRIDSALVNSSVTSVPSLFEAGYMMAYLRPHAVVVDVGRVGRANAKIIFAEAKRHSSIAVPMVIVGITGEDDPGNDEYKKGGCSVVFQKPVNVEEIIPLLCIDETDEEVK